MSEPIIEVHKIPVISMTAIKINDRSYYELGSSASKHNILLVSDDGFDQPFLIQKYLIEQKHCTVLSDEGITDMQTKFDYDGLSFALCYHSYEEGWVSILATCEDDENIKKFRLLAYDIDLNCLNSGENL